MIKLNKTKINSKPSQWVYANKKSIKTRIVLSLVMESTYYVMVMAQTGNKFLNLFARIYLVRNCCNIEKCFIKKKENKINKGSLT